MRGHAFPAGGGGNLNHPPKFRINRKKVGGTWSCPVDMPENPIPDIHAIVKVLENYGECKWCVATELHESGKKHYHAWCEYTKKLDVTSERAFDVCGVHPKLENPGKGWLTYVQKTEDFEANFKTRKPLKLISPTYAWEKEVLEIISGEPDDRKIYWYWSKEGNVGKTCFCKYLTAKHDALPLSGRGLDIRHGVVTYLNKRKYCPEVVVFPVPRSYDMKWLSYEGLESVKDMYFHSSKYEGEVVCGNTPHLFVFANHPPDEEKMSVDRWDIREILRPAAELPISTKSASGGASAAECCSAFGGDAGASATKKAFWDAKLASCIESSMS